MPEHGKPVSSLTQTLRWGDMDAYGHANNTVYFRFFEEARVNWLRSMDFNVEGNNTGPVIVTTGCTFLRELSYPATVTVDVYVGKAGNSSLDTLYTLSDESGEIKYAEGYAKVVWFDHKTRSSTPLPAELRALVEEYALADDGDRA